MQYAPYDLTTIGPEGNEMLRECLKSLDFDAPNSDQILSVCLGVSRFLMEKNKAYGDSALNPLRVFSKADTVEQIRVRMDDKLSRLARGDLAGEDAELDLLGYLVLLLVARKEEPR